MENAKSILTAKIKESLTSVIPITVIVLTLCFTIAPMPVSTLLSFIIGAVFLIIGMGLFTLGAEVAMSPMGEHVGSYITKKKKLFFIIIICFTVGFIITIAEPDLQVLATQVQSIDNYVLIISVAAGVGIFLIFALLRILFSVPLYYMLIIFYGIIIVLSVFVPGEFLPVAFDSGGVTTGPMTVPFIMALGVGVSSIRSDKNAQNDSFGLVAICSVGPILAVLILGMLYKPGDLGYTIPVVTEFADSKDLWSNFMSEFPHYMKDVLIALAPIGVFFMIFNMFCLKLPKRQLVKIGVGIIYTYAGLVLFLTGVNTGFMPVGIYLGEIISGLSYNWISVPIAMVIGYFIVAAEPAVHVLNKQVEEVTDGAISKTAMQTGLSIGVAVSLGLSMIRVLTGISIMWFIVPGYIIAVGLSFVVPKIFTSIAFDSGGVASGPMTATFLLPFAVGACSAVGGNVFTYAFGVVAMVAMTPLITIQILGLYYKIRQKKEESAENEQESADDEIIELDVRDN